MICYKYVILWVGMYLQNHWICPDSCKTLEYTPPQVIWGSLVGDEQDWRVPLSIQLSSPSGSQHILLFSWQIIDHLPTYIGAEYYSSQKAWGYHWRASAL